MSFNTSQAGSVQMKKFVTENEVEEQKRIRQEEWDRVRKPQDPKEAPEEVVDNRSLYERLQEQKNKKEAEYADQFALRNQIRTLDTDEIDFLQQISNEKVNEEQARLAEEESVLDELKSATRQLPDVIPTEPRPASSSKTGPLLPARSASKRSQKSLLSALVKKRRSNTEKEESNTLCAEGESVSRVSNLNTPAADVVDSSIVSADRDCSASERSAGVSDGSDARTGNTARGLSALCHYSDSDD